MTIQQRQSKLASRTKKLTIDEFYKVKAFTGEGFQESFENGVWKMIGYCVTSFNSLEDALDFILTDVITPNEDAAYSVIKSMSYNQKTSLLIDLMITDREVFKEFTLEDIETLKLEFSFIGDVRNRIVHGDWESYSENHQVKTKMKMEKDGFKFILTEFKGEDLYDDVEFIDKLSHRIWVDERFKRIAKSGNKCKELQ